MKKQTLTKGQRTRLLILEGAFEVIGLNGIEDTSFKMIADKVGLSQQGVMNHFKNRDMLFMGVLGHIKEKLYFEIEQSFTPYDDAFTLIKKHFLAQLTMVEKYPISIGLYLWLYYKASHNQKYQDLYTETYQSVKNEYIKYIMAGKREKIFHTEEDPNLVAEKLHDSFMGSIINFSTTHDYPQKKDDLVAKWIDVITHNLDYRKE